MNPSPELNQLLTSLHLPPAVVATLATTLASYGLVTPESLLGVKQEEWDKMFPPTLKAIPPALDTPNQQFGVIKSLTRIVPELQTATNASDAAVLSFQIDQERRVSYGAGEDDKTHFFWTWVLYKHSGNGNEDLAVGHSSVPEKGRQFVQVQNNQIVRPDHSHRHLFHHHPHFTTDERGFEVFNPLFEMQRGRSIPGPDVKRINVNEGATFDVKLRRGESTTLTIELLLWRDRSEEENLRIKKAYSPQTLSRLEQLEISRIADIKAAEDHLVDSSTKMLTSLGSAMGSIPIPQAAAAAQVFTLGAQGVSMFRDLVHYIEARHENRGFFDRNKILVDIQRGYDGVYTIRNVYHAIPETEAAFVAPNNQPARYGLRFQAKDSFRWPQRTGTQKFTKNVEFLDCRQQRTDQAGKIETTIDVYFRASAQAYRAALHNRP